MKAKRPPPLSPPRAVADIHQKLEGPETAVLGRTAQAERRVDDRLADLWLEVRGWRRFDHLLVPALGAALALAEVDQATGLVAEELNLDVAGSREELLDVETAVAESAFGFGLAAFVGLVDVAGRGDDASPAPAAAAERLDDHCSAIAEGGEEVACFLQGSRVIRAPQHGHVRGARGRTRLPLVAEQLQDLRPRTDEGDAGLRAGGGEVGVLGQEAVARVDRVAVRVGGPCDHVLDVEVGAHAASAECDHLVGDPQVEPVRVVFGIDGDGVNAEVHRRAGYPYRDLAAVGDQEAAHRLRG